MASSRPDEGPEGDRALAAASDSSEPSRAEVLVSLESVSSAPRQQALLRHIVGETLDGRGDRLKEYSIAVDVFGRASSFDPRTDSIVRVQASRLRTQLAEYYAGEGAVETLRIEVPAGGYQAVFQRAPPLAAAMRGLIAEELAAAPPAAGGASSSELRPASVGIWRGLLATGWLLPAAAAAGAVAAVLLIFSLFTVAPRRDPAVNLPSGPAVFVAQYELIDGPEFARILRDGLQYELINSLSRFPELSVLGIDTVYGASSEGARRNLHGADFILQGSVQATSSDVRVSSQLVETRSFVVVWSRTDRAEVSDASGIIDAQARIAGDVAGQLSQPYGVIQERLKEDLSASRAVSMEDYLCVLETYDYSRAKTQAKHAEVRSCLEQVTQHSPAYSPAWSKLSWMYGDEERYGFNRRNNDDAPFVRAKAAAERAVMTNSNSAMAHQYLAIAQFNLREDDDFRQSIETALRLNPNNSEILADAAQMLALLDGSERARELGEKAIAMNPGHPPWYHAPLANYHLLKGNKAEALEQARNGAPDGSPIAGFTLAAALRLNGDDVMADRALETVYATYPETRARRMEIVTSQRLPPQIVALVFGR
jgi:adenylate cyclase